ncbi:MAG TPA: 6-phospho-beta-glucosidase [Actinobacteria bacterium]|nr:6-phospho-beta-glucosidase [Actinomycetota bacterium]
MKVTVIGGGSTYTPELLEGFFSLWQRLKPLKISLYDINEEKLKIVSEFLKRMIKKSNAEIEFSATLSLEEALKDADFIISQIRIGGLSARLQDESIPLKFGLLGQETTGPGGFANALRTIPVVLDIAKKIEKISPNAWLINFTNPSGIITETLSRYTKVKVLGLCNVAINLQNDLSSLLNVPIDDIFLDCFGLNHLTFTKRVFVRGKDVTEEVFKKIKEQVSRRISKKDKKIVETIKMFPNYYLQYYYFREEKIKELKKKPKRAKEVEKIEKNLLKLYQDPDLNEKPKELSQRGGALYSTAAVNLISNLTGLQKGFQIINITNRGAISDLPEDSVVEIPVFIEKDRVQRCIIGKLPLEVKGTIQAVKAYEQLTIEAAVECSYRKALMALTQHPLVSSLTLAEKVLSKLIEANKEYFPKLS